MYKTTVNGKTFDIKSDADGISVNGDPFTWDMVKISDGYFHILHENKSYRAEVVSTDPDTKAITIKINGRKYPVHLKDKFDLLLEKMGMTSVASGKINNIKA